MQICDMEAQEKMELYRLNNDIKVFCITSSSFPEGIADAFKVLHSLLPSIDGREFFGISRPNKEGVIIYQAAVAELNPELFVCQRACFVFQHHRHAVSDRVGQAGTARDQFLFRAVIFKRAFGNGADQ